MELPAILLASDHPFKVYKYLLILIDDFGCGVYQAFITRGSKPNENLWDRSAKEMDRVDCVDWMKFRAHRRKRQSAQRARDIAYTQPLSMSFALLKHVSCELRKWVTYDPDGQTDRTDRTDRTGQTGQTDGTDSRDRQTGQTDGTGRQDRHMGQTDGTDIWDRQTAAHSS